MFDLNPVTFPTPCVSKETIKFGMSKYRTVVTAYHTIVLCLIHIPSFPNVSKKKNEGQKKVCGVGSVLTFLPVA